MTICIQSFSTTTTPAKKGVWVRHWRCRYRQIATSVSTTAHKHIFTITTPRIKHAYMHALVYAIRLAAFARIAWSPLCDFPNGTHAYTMCMLYVYQRRVGAHWLGNFFGCKQQESLFRIFTRSSHSGLCTIPTENSTKYQWVTENANMLNSMNVRKPLLFFSLLLQFFLRASSWHINMLNCLLA